MNASNVEEKARLVLETEATRQALAEKLTALGEAVNGAVTDAKDSIGEMVSNVSPQHQIQKHPIPALLVSVAGGCLVGAWLMKKSHVTAGRRAELTDESSAGPSLLRSIGREISPQLQAAKGLVTAYAFQRLSDWLRHSNPKLSETIDEIERGFLQQAVPRDVEKGSKAGAPEA